MYPQTIDRDIHITFFDSKDAVSFYPIVGNEYVRLSGMIRPQDISANNVVQSSRIANAKIAYLGVGDIADTGQKGWLSRALSSISPL